MDEMTTLKEHARALTGVIGYCDDGIDRWYPSLDDAKADQHLTWYTNSSPFRPNAVPACEYVFDNSGVLYPEGIMLCAEHTEVAPQLLAWAKAQLGMEG